MSGGGGTQSTTNSNAPPAEYMAAYRDVLGRAQGVASTPYQSYPGNLVAGFSPDQMWGYKAVENAQGAAQPYINQAAQNFQNANTPLAPQMQPYIDQAQAQLGNVANTNLAGAIAPWQQQAAQGYGAGFQGVSPQQYSGQALQQYMSPYTQSVVNATEQQFNNQNAIQANQLRGNAASANALGSDRVGVAQGVLAGQQQAQEAPVIAGLYNQGFGQAQQEFNQQQQTHLAAQQANRAAQMQAGQGYAGLGQQSLTAAQQQAALRAQAAQGYAGLGQAELGAGQAQGWLSAQSGAGLAGLGSQALTTQLEGANALLGAGATQQQQAQSELNVPYEQWLASRSYPFQTTSWLSNIAQGLGSGAGGTGTTTSPTAGLASQIAGAGAGTVGLVGATGGFGKDGWLTGSNGLGSQAGNWFGGNGMSAGMDAASAGNAFANEAAATAGASNIASGAGQAYGMLGAAQRGGAIKGFAAGGVPDVSQGPLGGAGGIGAPGAQNIVVGGVPDASATGIPSGTDGGGPSYMKRDWGTTTTRPIAPHDSIFGTLLKTAGEVAATVYGGPAGGAAATALSSQVHFGKGGHVPSVPHSFAAGGTTPITLRGFADGGGADQPYGDYLSNARTGLPPHGARNIVPSTSAPAHGGMGIPRPPAAAKPDSGFGDAKSLLGDLNLGDWMKPNDGRGQARGGMVRGFADGGGADLPPAAADYDSTTFNPQNFVPPRAPAVDTKPPATAEQAGPPMPPGMAHRALVGDTPPAADTPPSGAGSAPASHPAARARVDTAALARTAPPVQPPPPHSDYTSNPGGVSPGAQAPNRDDPYMAYINDLRQTRAHMEDRANPWLSLATAGFGMAAGNSPHFLQNLGAGAVAGIKQYVSSDQAAKQLAAKVDENIAQLATAQSYHQASLGSRERGQDLTYQAKEDARQNTLVLAQMHAMAAIARAAHGNEHATAGDLQSTAIRDLMGQDNPATGKRWTYAEAFHQTNSSMYGADTRATTAAAGLDEKRDRDAALAEYQRAMVAGRVKTQEDLEHWRTYLKGQHATDQDIRVYSQSKDLMGKPTITPSEAHAAGEGFRAENQQTAGAGPVLPKVGETRGGYTYRGGDPSVQSSWVQGTP